jgi:hypothetical protein
MMLKTRARQTRQQTPPISVRIRRPFRRKLLLYWRLIRKEEELRLPLLGVPAAAAADGWWCCPDGECGGDEQ